jgi:hypothetical protein
MIHNSKRRETCDYVYYYMGFTAAGNDSAGNRQRSGLYIGGNNQKEKAQEGRCLGLVVLDNYRISWM